MLKITDKDIYKLYDCLKNRACKSFAKGDIPGSIDCISKAGKLASFFNWKYCDEEIEELLTSLSKNIFSTVSREECIKGKFVFYDYNAKDNCTLTQQYIRAIISWGGELLYIPEDLDDIKSRDIIQELSVYSKAEIYCPDKSVPLVERLLRIYQQIIDFKPEKVFIQLAPWSVEAVVLFNVISLPEKYYLDITDHAFYIGNRCANYYIEFRNRGCYIAFNKRNIPHDKILYQAYYPIVTDKQYMGLSEEVEISKCIILSAGNVYKVGDVDSTYFEVLRRILEKYLDVVFVFIGIGKSHVFKEFIAKYHLEGRVFCYPTRKDINEVIKRSDIYFNTYPFSGGLLCQYAAVHAKPIIAYNQKERQSDFVESILCDKERLKITYSSIDSVVEEFSNLIENENYRQEVGGRLQKCIISPERFNRELKELVQTNRSVDEIKDESISDQLVFERYLDLQNTSMLNCYALVFRNLDIFIKIPMTVLKFYIQFLFRYTKVLYFEYLK